VVKIYKIKMMQKLDELYSIRLELAIICRDAKIWRSVKCTTELEGESSIRAGLTYEIIVA
jgi:hypothetical protein